MAKHSPGITQAQIDELIAIDVAQLRAASPLDNQGYWHWPVEHPVQRHVVEEPPGSALMRGAGAGTALAIELLFAWKQGSRPLRNPVVFAMVG